MHILQLCDNFQEMTDIGEVIKYLNYYKVVDKFKIDNISLVSYDAFIITVDFLTNNYDVNISFFEELKKLKKPIIYVYHSNNNLDDYGMKLLADKYKIKFQLSDCSVLETPNWNYKPATYSNYDEALSMNSSMCKGFCNIKNTNQFYILKKNNIIVMHDLYINWYGQHQLDVSRMPNMVKFILQIDEVESEEKVDWLNNINILDDIEIREKLNTNSKKIQKLLKEKEKLDNKTKENEYYKSILYSSGDKLVEVVKVILEEMLNIVVNDTDLKKQDLYFNLDNKNILVEVKGVNHPFQRDNISQVKRHVKDFAEENQIYGADVDKNCKGVLILNPYSKHDLEEKISKDFYSKEVIADAEYEKVCTLDTLTLLNYYSKWKNDSKSVDMKTIILNTNYNKPDYNDIINL